MNTFWCSTPRRFLLALVLMMQVASCTPWAGMPGAFSRADTRSSAVLEAARFAVKTIADTSFPGSLGTDGTDVQMELVKVLRAYSQVVNGVNYSMTLEVRVGKDRRMVSVRVHESWDGTAKYRLESQKNL